MKNRRITAIIFFIMLAAAVFGPFLSCAYAAEDEFSYDTRFGGFLGRGLVHDGRFSEFDKHYGLDVSAHQKEVDWELVAAGGAEFAFIRVGYRGYETGLIVEDQYAVYNVREALRNGLKIGVYIYSQAISKEEGIEEADFVLDFLDRNGLGPANLMLPIVYDVEYPSSNGKYGDRPRLFAARGGGRLYRMFLREPLRSQQPVQGVYVEYQRKVSGVACGVHYE